MVAEEQATEKNNIRWMLQFSENLWTDRDSFLIPFSPFHFWYFFFQCSAYRSEWSWRSCAFWQLQLPTWCVFVSQLLLRKWLSNQTRLKVLTRATAFVQPIHQRPGTQQSRYIYVTTNWILWLCYVNKIQTLR